MRLGAPFDAERRFAALGLAVLRARAAGFFAVLRALVVLRALALRDRAAGFFFAVLRLAAGRDRAAVVFAAGREPVGFARAPDAFFAAVVLR